MLTLQNVLDSDSISTLVGKLNANFQTIAMSNGGPQGVRGEQGIPGLPGKQGSTGPSGPAGATGPGMGLIPFSALTQGVNLVGGVNQPQLSLDFLLNANPLWGPGTGPVHGQMWFDNNQLGWWKYLTYSDPENNDPIAGDLEIYPYDLAGFTGPNWYFYPLNFSSIIALTQGIWSVDKTNYLGLVNLAYGAPTGPDPTTQLPFSIPNARFNSKFGTVWISSMDDTTNDNIDNDTDILYNWDYANSTRLNSGIDRVLFKMSIDGTRFYDNMKARAHRSPADDLLAIIGAPYSANANTINVPTTGPLPNIAGANPLYFVQPLYEATIDAYAPILYYTNRTDTASNGNSTNAGSLGYYQYAAENGSIQIHNFSTRTAEEFVNIDNVTLLSSSNVGEMLFDVRRFITSNQYLNLFPQDTNGYASIDKITTAHAISPYNTNQSGYYEEWGGPKQWKSFQGYHSLFTGQKVVDAGSAGNLAVIPNVFTWIYDNRQSWYGTSIYESGPNPEIDADNTELIRSAGFMARGMNGTYTSGATPYTGYVDGVLVYTANTTGTGPASGPSYATLDPAQGDLQSLPVAYFSPARNVGIGTMSMDKIGIFEPNARLHSHADWRPELEAYNTVTDYTALIDQGAYYSIDKTWFQYSKVAKRRLKSAAFTIERENPALIYGTGSSGAYVGSRFETGPAYFDDWNTLGVFNDLLLGAIDAPYNEVTALGYTSLAKAAAGIRYESFNEINTGPRINRYDPARNKAWAFRGALRLGTTPLFNSFSAADADGYEIGANASYQNIDYQFHISPLAFSQGLGLDADVVNNAISGIGIHTLYPRTRFHLYGKNIYQEFKGDEAVTPGYVEPLLLPGFPTLPTSWKNYPSNYQISIDQIRDTFVYNSAAFDYAYDYLVLPPLPGGFGISQYSNNARNYPTRDSNGANAITLSTWNSTLNQSDLGSINTGTNLGKSALHGGYWNAYWNLDKYIGFNMFRDLLAKGDERGENVPGTGFVPGTFTYAFDQHASVWRVGTDSTTKDGFNANDLPPSNGGSAIISDSDGRLGFAFIPKWRDGGYNYAQWEQQNIGTREVVNNVKIIFDQHGNIGIGNAPGLDPDAYASTNWNRLTGELNYLPNANSGAADPTATGPVAYSSGAGGGVGAWSPAPNDRYGLSHLAYGANASAAVNAQATLAENIRLEIGAEKAQGRPGHHAEKRGYGYPGFKMDANGKPTGIGGTITIGDNATNTFAHRYLGVPLNSFGWAGAQYVLTTDNLGRLISFTVEFTVAQSNPLPAGINAVDLYSGFTIPHPTDFAKGGPFDPAAFPSANFLWASQLTLSIIIDNTQVTNSQSIWIPISAVAGELETLTGPPGPSGIVAGTFVYDELKPATMRLNNFVLGDGYEFIRNSGESGALIGFTDTTLATTKKIFDARTSSSKLLLTHAGIDYAGMTEVGLDLGKINLLIDRGLAPVIKVTSIIESAQDETSVRTYTIPKADNTGGSFLVVTDHMGVKQKDQPGLTPLPQPAAPAPNRFRIERITTFEAQRTSNDFVQQTANYYTFPSQTSDNYAYEMLNIQYWDNNYLPHTHGVDGQYYPSILAAAGVENVAEIQRNTDSYWKINEDNYASRFWSDPDDPKTGLTSTNEEFAKSEVRYSRLNENYLLFDFNLSIDPLDYIYTGNIGATNRYIGNEVTGLFDGGYSHSPWAAGYLVNQYYYDAGNEYTDSKFWAGIDARWVQYVRVAYDIGANADFNGTLSNDPDFYENEYGGGANFNNWNDFRAWYPGTAVVGSDTNVDADNYIDLQTRGWAATTDGSPYNNFGSTTNLRFTGTGVSPQFQHSKTWNGRLTDWYWSRHQDSTFNVLETWTQAGLPFDVNQINANPWSYRNTFGTLGVGNNGYFKHSLINQFGYGVLQAGWWQAVGAPEGAGSVGFGAPNAMIPISIPQYFDALVWRSFGDDAWNRNGNFQWRVTPYYSDPDSLGTAIPFSERFNTFVIEIMFDKPIYVSGAKRRVSTTVGDYDANAYLPDYSAGASNTEMYSPLQDPAGEFLGTQQPPCETVSKSQADFYTGITTNGLIYKPHGTITLRGQAMLQYKKSYNKVDPVGGGNP